MYYLFLGPNQDYQNPEMLVVFYQGNYFVRKKRTDWDLLDEEDIEKIINGTDHSCFSIEEDEFNRIIDSWNGDRFGYKNMNFGAEYDDTYDTEEYDD